MGVFWSHNMKQVITDLTKPTMPTPPKLKPITLDSCLQDSVYKREFSKGDFTSYLKYASKVTRLTTITTTQYSSFRDYERDLIEVDGCIFIGQWNDGVVE
ncbi:MAG: hypothetical protein EBT92_17545 [Planctomycetes bacterium]|nr:hypothetical protein [Planctomycetota bacterium]